MEERDIYSAQGLSTLFDRNLCRREAPMHHRLSFFGDRGGSATGRGRCGLFSSPPFASAISLSAPLRIDLALQIEYHAPLLGCTLHPGQGNIRQRDNQSHCNRIRGRGWLLNGTKRRMELKGESARWYELFRVSPIIKIIVKKRIVLIMSEA